MVNPFVITDPQIADRLRMMWQCFKCGGQDARTKMGAIYCASCDERLPKAP